MNIIKNSCIKKIQFCKNQQEKGHLRPSTDINKMLRKIVINNK